MPARSRGLPSLTALRAGEAQRIGQQNYQRREGSRAIINATIAGKIEEERQKRAERTAERKQRQATTLSVGTAIAGAGIGAFAAVAPVLGGAVLAPSLGGSAVLGAAVGSSIGGSIGSAFGGGANVGAVPLQVLGSLSRIQQQNSQNAYRDRRRELAESHVGLLGDLSREMKWSN